MRYSLCRSPCPFGTKKYQLSVVLLNIIVQLSPGQSIHCTYLHPIVGIAYNKIYPKNTIKDHKTKRYQTKLKAKQKTKVKDEEISLQSKQN